MLRELFLEGKAGQGKLLQVHAIAHDVADECLFGHPGIR